MSKFIKTNVVVLPGERYIQNTYRMLQSFDTGVIDILLQSRFFAKRIRVLFLKHILESLFQ